MVTDSEILGDIQHIYKKIDQCYRSKEDLYAQIAKERGDIINLERLIEVDVERAVAGKKPRYDEESMKANIQRLRNNIVLFQETIVKEDQTIEKFRMIVDVLQSDMARPKEIVIDATS